MHRGIDRSSVIVLPAVRSWRTDSNLSIVGFGMTSCPSKCSGADLVRNKQLECMGRISDKVTGDLASAGGNSRLQ
jgi:hypothetical protein